jgi:vacuolar protein-sorting-associated protein 4
LSTYKERIKCITDDKSNTTSKNDNYSTLETKSKSPNKRKVEFASDDDLSDSNCPPKKKIKSNRTRQQIEEEEETVLLETTTKRTSIKRKNSVLESEEYDQSYSSQEYSQEKEEPTLSESPKVKMEENSPMHEYTQSELSKTEDEEKVKQAPNELQQCVIRNTTTRWSDVAGLDDAIRALKEAAVLPVTHPHLFNKDRRPWRAVLLYGPPGTGKTHLATALATETRATFFAITPSNILSEWMGHSEKMVRQLFETAEKLKPSVIFFDEVDSLASTRSKNESETARRIKTELLVQMQGLSDKEGIVVVAATNVPWELDPAIRRRFERRIFVPLPDCEARKKILYNSISNTPHNLVNSDFAEIASKCENYSGADMSCMIKYALLEPIRRLQAATHFKPERKFYVPCNAGDTGAIKCSVFDLRAEYITTPITTKEDFMNALAHWNPSNSHQDIVQHREFMERYGQSVY